MEPEIFGLMIFLIVACNIMLAAAARIVGGRKWSAAVIGFQIRILRWIPGMILMVLGSVLLSLGKFVKGGKAPRLPRGSGNRRNSQSP
ncbi:MAG: hypothetical protein ACOYUZ_05235 [Patescibacteria group bacterium]